MRKNTLCLCAHLCRSKGQLEDRKRMIVSQPAGSCRLTVKRAFCMVSVTGRDQAIYTRQICFLIEHHILPALGSIFVVL